MVWSTRRCDLGHSHKVWTQERDNACGPSCMMMAYERITGQTPADESLFYEAYNKYGNDNKKVAKGKKAPKKTTGFQYTNATNLADTMSKFIGKATAKNVGKSNLVESVFGAMMGHQKPKPVIGLVNWSGGGGHFVVIDQITMQDGSLEMCVCDPWDGNVHLIGSELSGKIGYRTNHAPSAHQTLSKRSGRPRTVASAGGKAVGNFNGWLIMFQ